MAADTSMDVDMDFELDMDNDEELARLQAGTAALSALPSALQPDNDTDAMMTVEDGELQDGGQEILPHKIHISGLETLQTQDIENFTHDHFPSESHVKIEWVNDSSANIVYASGDIAAAALKAFALTPTDDPLEPRRAQQLLTHPDVDLYVRLAVATDVKPVGASKYSKFYLNNPELDPESRPRRGGLRGRGRGNGYRRGGGYQDDRYDRPRRRRSSTIEPTFDVNLYDDDPASIKARITPTAPSSDRSRRPRNGEDLFANRAPRNHSATSRRSSSDLLPNSRPDGRLRNRSASPVRDGDGRYGFTEDQPYRQTARHRTPPPARPRSTAENYGARAELRADLFAHRRTGSELAPGGRVRSPPPSRKAPIELFANKGSTAPAVKELFPDKAGHRRQEAKDIRAEEVVSAIGRFDMSDERDSYGRNGGARNGGQRNGEDLMAKNRGGVSQNGRLTEENGGDDGFQIRGRGSSGFSILGASKSAMPPPDLFDRRAREGVRGGRG
ncbi:unnamed protein product [Zymoseptoria tritici ST99CH_1A5]|uniref:Uncharacterized protein n=2 Tax=Zymoseptoria tritici TaxID=1047171 RepID=A0A1X7S873_ZYMT9|nr:unnamed protein product [Zymoseptoria tritici ST99CH_3D7]SMR64050.1 unnamed protein product [Zymoseptoria tritici ST99CH_3D1]SMY29401.1 unnamed protein product [Zymoseptoria tritici ST99CH_1A5]